MKGTGRTSAGRAASSTLSELRSVPAYDRFLTVDLVAIQYGAILLGAAHA
jgi:hypothetical protein